MKFTPIICLALALSSQKAVSETVAIQPTAVAPITPTPATPTPTAPATTSTPASRDYYSSGGGSNQSNGSNINQGAGEGKKSQLAGMAQNLLTAGMMVAMAQAQPPNSPTKYLMYAMAALSAAQGAMLGGDAGKSAATEEASQYNPQSTNYDSGNYEAPSTPYTPDTTGEIGVLAAKNKSGAEAMKALTEASYTLDKNGLKDPSGKTTPLSSFSSPGGLAAAGMDAQAIEKVQKVLEQVGASSNRVVAMGLDGGGGGGRSPGSSDDDAWAKSLSAWTMKNPFAKSKEDQKNLVAGKTVSLHGEPIGVAADNIFHKISKHYSNKRERKEFID